MPEAQGSARGPIKLTSAVVESLPTLPTRYDVPDSELPGLMVRVSAAGVKSYAFRYRNRQGVRRRDTIGRHPGLTADQARKIARRKAGEVAGGGDPQEEKREERTKGKGCPTLAAFISGDYGAWARTNRRTGEQTIARLKASFPALQDTALNQITAWNIEKWRAARHKDGISKSTTDRDIIALRALLTHAVAAGHIERNPLSGFRLSRPDNGRIRFLSPDEERALRKALEDRERKTSERRTRYAEWCLKRNRPVPTEEDRGYSDHLSPLVLLALNTGARRGELLSLTWGAVDLERCVLTVEAHTAKTAKTRHINLNIEAVDVLRRWQPKNATGLVFPGHDGKRMQHFKRSWSALMVDAKIENFTFHDLRHTFASKLVMAGVSLVVVRDLLGHSSITMTERYAHLAPDAKADAVAKLVQGV